MLKTTNRTHAQARRSAYIDPISLAEDLLAAGKPLPLDLQDDLEALGIMVDEFCRLHHSQRTMWFPGFSIENPPFHSAHLSVCPFSN